jgi:hypothetical protein
MSRSAVPDLNLSDKLGKPMLITFILDQTGSMESVKNDTIGGFNTYIDTLRKDGEHRYEFNLIKFSSIRTEETCVRAKLSEVPRLNSENYRPDGGTPLYDAIGKAIKATTQAIEGRSEKPNVVIAIQTDGEENASREYTLESIKQLIQTKQELGWVFTFMGCGIDAYKGGGAMGISRNTTVSYGRGESLGAFAMASASTMRYAATGDLTSASYTDEEKAAVGDPTVTSTVKP